jgi:hypothetical protein
MKMCVEVVVQLNHSSPRHWMEMNRQIHVQATLPPVTAQRLGETTAGFEAMENRKNLVQTANKLRLSSL